MYLGVVFLKEMDNTDIVFEGDNVGFGESFHRRHVYPGGFQCSEDVLGQSD